MLSILVCSSLLSKKHDIPSAEKILEQRSQVLRHIRASQQHVKLSLDLEAENLELMVKLRLWGIERFKEMRDNAHTDGDASQ